MDIIEIIDDQRYIGSNIKPGRYELQPYDSPTEAQNRCFHGLLQEYWTSGCHSYNAKNFLHFRELIKLYLCAGSEKYYSLIDDNGKPVEEPIVRWRVKSWTRYSKKERSEAISRIIAEMETVGVDTPKYREILKGLEDNANAKYK